jgi:Xaa-Pro aminopeptidase
VFLAYAVVTPSKAILFVDPAQVDDALKAYLGDVVQIHPYTGFLGYLTGLSKEISVCFIPCELF